MENGLFLQPSSWNLIENRLRNEKIMQVLLPWSAHRHAGDRNILFGKMLIVKKFRLFLLIPLAIVLSACAIQQPKITIGGVSHAKVAHEKATVDVVLHVDNHNGLSIPVQSGKANIFLNGVLAGSGIISHHVTILSNATTSVIVPVTLSIPVAKKQVLESIFSKGVSYKVVGELYVKGVSHAYSFTRKGVYSWKMIKKLVRSI